jgi:hypothetical protein
MPTCKQADLPNIHAPLSDHACMPHAKPPDSLKPKSPNNSASLKPLTLSGNVATWPYALTKFTPSQKSSVSPSITFSASNLPNQAPGRRAKSDRLSRRFPSSLAASSNISSRWFLLWSLRRKLPDPHAGLQFHRRSHPHRLPAQGVTRFRSRHLSTASRPRPSTAPSSATSTVFACSSSPARKPTL